MRIVIWMKTDVAVIPGGLTSVSQSLHVSDNRPFKDNVRKLYTLSLYNSSPPFVPAVKFVGLLLDSKLSWETHLRWHRAKCEWSLIVLKVQ
jgi:hypothetical protein